MKSKETWEKEHEAFLKVFDEASEELKKYPGVISVEIGIKEKGNELTDELSFRVYVQKKKPDEQLTPSQIIPKEIKGFKTDVIEIDVPTVTVNTSKHRPLKGGIQITNDKGSTGTLGCIARLNSDNSLVALSNSHVLKGGGATGTIKAGQAAYRKSCCCECDVIGEVTNDRHDGSVDCGIVKINSDTQASNLVRMLNTDGTDGSIEGSAIVSTPSSDPVVKIGRTSDKTTGIVVSITHPTVAVPAEGTPARTNQILIRPSTGTTLFQDRGDSGSVLIDQNKKVIGLMWGAYLSSPSHPLYGHGIACPIEAVKTALGITIIEGGLNTSLGLSANAPQPMEDKPTSPNQILEKLEYMVSAYPQGEKIKKVINNNIDELFHLVNHVRAVTLVWQRNQGPAFVAHLLNSVKDPACKIPSTVKNIALQTMLGNMAKVLLEHGSEKLRTSINEYGNDIITCAEDCKDVETFMSRLNHTVPV